MRFLIFILALFGPNIFALLVRNDRNTGHHCNVREPEFSYNFEFTNLTNKNEDYIIEHDKDVVLRIQPCEPLIKKCNGAEGYSICISKHGQEIGIGRSPPDIQVEFGKIIFKYTGDPCDKRRNYTVDIRMICDLAVKDANGMTLYTYGYNECNFNLDWKTDAACIKDRKMVSCTVNDGTNHYDLSQLLSLSNNYEVYINERFSIILNVCHSILYGPGSCKSDNAACLVDKQSKKSKNLGVLKNNVQFNPIDGSLSLTYDDGAICTINVPKVSTMQTTITFICDLNATGTLPEYSGGMEECQYNVTWRTASACTEEALHIKSLDNINNNVCTVKNPVTNKVYNLTSLMNKEFKIHPFGLDAVIYRFSVCGTLTNTTCKPGSGACRQHKSVSGGMGNSKLMWKETGPYLNYTNGDICLKHKQMYTIIEFYCGPDVDYEIDDNDLCHDIIKMNTHLLCDRQQTNCASFNNEVNFKQLSLKNNNYVIKSDNAEYHINICQPLVAKNGLNCSGAALCKNTIFNGKIINVTNLGYPDQRPIVTSDRSAVLIYHNGSICDEDKKRRIESSISFLCDIDSEHAVIQFKSYNNCTYFFEMKTNIVCGQVDGSLSQNCSITNTLGDFRNLSLLADNTDPVYYVENETKSKTYKITLCGDKKNCNGAFICNNEINYGTKISVLSDYSKNLINLRFTKGSKCSGGSLAESTFTITCKEESVNTKPALKLERPCHVHFEWHTNKICIKHNLQNIPSLFSAETATTAMTVSPTASNSLNGIQIGGITMVLLIILAIAIYCYLDPSRRLRLLDMITNSTTRNCDRVKYSRVCWKKYRSSSSLNELQN